MFFKVMNQCSELTRHLGSDLSHAIRCDIRLDIAQISFSTQNIENKHQILYKYMFFKVMNQCSELTRHLGSDPSHTMSRYWV